MTQEADVIGGNTSASTTTALDDLVGEGKKYKDVQALAASRIEADRFIEQLKSENSELRKSLDGKGGSMSEESIKALLERIDAATKPKEGATAPETLTREEIEKLVKDGMTQELTAQSRRVNYATANATLVNAFGGSADLAGKHVEARIAQLGLTKEAVKQLAEERPQVFKELFVPAPKKPEPTPTVAGGKLPNPEPGTERNAAYYSKLRKEMGSKFWQPAIQQQMFADKKRLGDKF